MTPIPPSPRQALPLTPPVPSAPLDVEVVHDDGSTCVALAGELTYTTVALFTERLVESLVPSGPLLVLDVARLHFCDSVGLSALIGAQRRARLVGGDVVLTGVQGSLARHLAVTGAGQLFGVVGVPDPADAPAPEWYGYAGEPV